jgi:hypothetical protein
VGRRRTSWTNVTKSGVNLTAGVHVLRLYTQTNGTSGYVANFNKITVSPSGPPAAMPMATRTLPMFADLNGDDERAPDNVLPA